VSLVLVIYH